MARPEPGEPGLVEHVALDRRDAREAFDLVGIAGDGGDLMAAAGELGGDSRAGPARGADDGDLHGILLFWYLSVTRYPKEAKCEERTLNSPDYPGVTNKRGRT
jgi:hypothetical protein